MIGPVRALLPDRLPGWRRLVAAAVGTALAAVLLPGAAVVLFDLSGQGPSASPTVTAERFLHHIGHRDYDQACEMASGFRNHPKPFQAGSKDYDTCLGTLVWLGGGENWNRTDLANASRARVLRVSGTDDFRYVGRDDVRPELPPIRKVIGGGTDPFGFMFLLMQRIGGKWYVVWPT